MTDYEIQLKHESEAAHLNAMDLSKLELDAQAALNSDLLSKLVASEQETVSLKAQVTLLREAASDMLRTAVHYLPDDCKDWPEAVTLREALASSNPNRDVVACYTKGRWE